MDSINFYENIIIIEHVRLFMIWTLCWITLSLIKDEKFHYLGIVMPSCKALSVSGNTSANVIEFDNKQIVLKEELQIKALTIWRE